MDLDRNLLDKHMKPEDQAAYLQGFLSDTKKRFDTYFAHLGYVCLVFDKDNHKGESIQITNTTIENVLAVLEPYANAKELAEAKVSKNKLKKLRRVK